MHRKNVQSIAVAVCLAALILCFILTAGCASTEKGDQERAANLFSSAAERISSIHWSTDPPGIIISLLSGSEVDLKEMMMILDGIDTGGDKDLRMTVYTMKIIGASSLDFVASAKNLASAIHHIENAEDYVKLFQYDDWYIEMQLARNDLDYARGYLAIANDRMQGIDQTQIPSAMKGDVEELRMRYIQMDMVIEEAESSILASFE